MRFYFIFCLYGHSRLEKAKLAPPQVLGKFFHDQPNMNHVQGKKILRKMIPKIAPMLFSRSKDIAQDI